jgi:tetratricopeptide (TPR) repeat protein
MRLLPGASLAVLAMLAVGSFTSSGCAQVGDLKARKAFKAANQAYQAQDYKQAASLYEEAVQAAPESQPAKQALFFLANCYDQLWKPSKKGEPDNDALMTKAVENYQKAAEKLASSNDPVDKTLAKRSLEFLVAAYRADKLNDPAKAEPVVQKMIQLEPGEPSNYFALATIYEEAGVYDEAERMLQAARQAKPSDPAVYLNLAAYYNRQGQFDKTIEALEERAKKEPNNPEAFYTISVYYWEKAYRDFKLTDKEKKEYVDKGEAAVEQALKLKPDYVEAIVYKGLLLRLEANLEKDPGKQQSLIKQAEALSAKAADLRKQKAAGVSQ